MEAFTDDTGVFLKIQNLTIVYKTKELFISTGYEAYSGRINVIQGVSGSGKSSFIQALMGRFSCEYTVNNCCISDLSEEEKAAFINSFISVVYQEPLFFEELTIEDNIEFVKQNNYIKQTDDDSLLEKLLVSDLLKLYPDELSTGEKARAALYIALLKKPLVLILDEPTASLDSCNKEMVIQVLEDYALDNLVICTSHDRSFEKHVCNFAIISEQRIVQKSAGTCRYKELTCFRKSIPVFSFVKRYLHKSMQHHRFLKIIHVIINSLTVISMFAALNLNDAFSANLQSDLNHMNRNEIIVYQSIDEALPYSFTGNEYPLSDDQTDALRNIDCIKNLTPRIDIETPVTNYALYMELFTDCPDVFEALEDQRYQVVQIHEKSKDPGTPVVYPNYIHAYSGNNDYTDQIIKEWSDTGVLLTESVYMQIQKKESLEQPYISFYLPVPVYDCSGNSQTADPKTVVNGLTKNTRWIDCNQVVCRPAEITLPIRGVIKDYYIGGKLNTCILVPESVFAEEMKADTQLPDMMNVYIIGRELSYYIDVLPEQYINESFEKGNTEGNAVYRLTKWKPSAFSVKLDDVGKIDALIKELKSIGLEAENDYINSKTLILIRDETRKILTGAAGSVLGIIIIAELIFVFLHRGANTNLNEMLFIIGYSQKEKNSFFRMLYAIKGFAYAAAAVLGYYLMAFAVLQTGHFVIKPTLWAIIGIAVVAYMANGLLPYMEIRLLHKTTADIK